MIPIEYILAAASVLLLLNIIASKTSGRVGVPSLLILECRVKAIKEVPGN